MIVDSINPETECALRAQDERFKHAKKILLGHCGGLLLRNARSQCGDSENILAVGPHLENKLSISPIESKMESF